MDRWEDVGDISHVCRSSPCCDSRWRAADHSGVFDVELGEWSVDSQVAVAQVVVGDVDLAPSSQGSTPKAVFDAHLRTVLCVKG
jgi:hypothetical protein